MRLLPFSFLFLSLILIAGCGDENQPKEPASNSPEKLDSPLFSTLTAAETGISFANNIDENPNRNYFKYLYYYNGGGVAIGDIDNDGLSDIYVTGNLVENKLYKNLGGMKFQDITSSAGVMGSDKWTTGVTMADVNGDGFLDIYVCQSGMYDLEEKRANLLYINNGDATFTEKGAEYGVNDVSQTTHATFFDMDLDGDLDLYVVNHSIYFGAVMDQKLLMAANPGPYESNRLYRNDGEKFTDITEAAGVRKFGFGLSASVGDLNDDGYPDIYVANDFAEADFLYINNQNGTFTDRLQEYTRHISQFGMGTDINDINNDGLMDVVELDMMAEENLRKKTMMSGMQPEAFWFNVRIGYHFQYMQNTLQLNNGNGTFSEIGELAGISTTDWSWAPLLADFDNDGWKDLFVTNGYRRDVRDNDFMKSVKKMDPNESIENYQITYQLMPVNKIANYAFRNTNGLQFEKVSKEWGLDFKGFSNGAAYADLDNDGDLDLVVNNLDEPVQVFRNNCEKTAKNWLRVKLTGPKGNSMGIGARVRVRSNGVQSQEMVQSRGYQSAVEPVLHFGLGAATSAPVEVIWPDGKSTAMGEVKANQVITVEYPEGSQTGSISWAAVAPKPINPWVEEVTRSSGINFTHKEKEFDDYKREILLPHKQSTLGPFISSGDINGDGLADFFIGGAAGQSGKIYLQNAAGKFTEANNSAFRSDQLSEDMGSAFFDADGDGDLDLYVVSGSNEYEIGDEKYQDRLYINNGGTMSKATGKLPKMLESGSCVVPMDMDGDNDWDLFVGGRMVAGKYPIPAKSTILRNDNGVFSDVTESWGKAFLQAGMVTDAVAADFNGDGKTDLAIAGEWMPVRIFSNTGSQFEEQTEKMGIAGYKGWWYSLSAADIDKDGDMDLLAGNLGLNTKYKGTEDAPFEVYAADFDGSGNLDIVLGYYNNGKPYPVRGRTCTSQQMPFIKEKFPTYKQFGAATLPEIYGDKLDSAVHYTATWMQTSVLLNEGTSFKMVPLPVEAQFSAGMGVEYVELPGKGPAIVVAGNLHDAEVETARHDGSIGAIIQITQTAPLTFRAVPVTETGFFAWGDIRDMKILPGKIGAGTVLLAGNDEKLQVYRLLNGAIN